MVAQYLLSLVALLATASAIATRTRIALINPLLASWTGEVIPGQGNVTLYGNYSASSYIESIFTMVLDMNPNYNSTASVSGLEAGDAAPALNCAKNFATGNSEQTNAQVWAIKQLAGYWNNPAGECFRMSCGDTTGVYWCNDNKAPATQSGITLATWGEMVNSGCCTWSEAYGEHEAISGQTFGGDGTNIILGYANCNDPAEVRPATYIYPGPNGKCIDMPTNPTPNATPSPKT